jgi:hypothetical protein
MLDENLGFARKDKLLNKSIDTRRNGPESTAALLLSDHYRFVEFLNVRLSPAALSPPPSAPRVPVDLRFGVRCDTRGCASGRARVLWRLRRVFAPDATALGDAAFKFGYFGASCRSVHVLQRLPAYVPGSIERRHRLGQRIAPSEPTYLCSRTASGPVMRVLGCAGGRPP